MGEGLLQMYIFPPAFTGKHFFFFLKYNSLLVRSEILGQNSVHIEMFNVLSIQYCLSKDPFKSIPKNCVVEFLLYQQWIK